MKVGQLVRSGPTSAKKSASDDRGRASWRRVFGRGWFVASVGFWRFGSDFAPLLALTPDLERGSMEFKAVAELRTEVLVHLEVVAAVGSQPHRGDFRCSDEGRVRVVRCCKFVHSSDKFPAEIPDDLRLQRLAVRLGQQTRTPGFAEIGELDDRLADIPGGRVSRSAR